MDLITSSPTSGTRRTRFAVVAAAVLFCAALAGTTPGAHADNVGDLQARARQIAEQLNNLEREQGALADQFDGVQIKAQQVAARIAMTRRQVTHANATIDKRRKALARYLLGAYVDGGGNDDVTAMLEGKQSTALRRDGYVSAAVGDQQQLVDDFQAARANARDTLDSLRRAEASQAKLQSELLAKQQSAEDLTRQAEALQAQVQGKLKVAVAQQQGELAKEAAAAAAKRWNAQNGNDAGSTGGAPTSTPRVGSPGTGTTTTVPGDPTTPTTTPGSPATPTPPTTPGAPPTTAPPVTAPPVTSPPAPAPPSSGGATAANAALAELGVPYSWGGGNSSGPSYGFGTGAHTKGFDCSGLVLYAWAQAGVYLYHNAQSQYDSIRHVPLSQLEPGDLVFYGDSANTIDHVSIYVGGGTVVHAPHTGSVVQEGPVYLWDGYFAWIGAGRPA